MEQIHASGWPPENLGPRPMAVERESACSRGIDRISLCCDGTGLGIPALAEHHLVPAGHTPCGSLSLFWYAWDTVTIGDRPLNTASIQNIRQVVQGVMMEDAGAIVDWQHPDEQGSIPLRIE